VSEPVIFVGGRGEYFLARVPALPGCVASGRTRDDAIANARRAFRAHLELLDARGVSIDHWRGLDPDRFAVADFPESGLLPGEERGLEEHEIRDFLHVFEAQRAALLALMKDLDAEELQRKPDEGTWSVRETIEHMMTTQASLLSRLERWPEDPFNTFQSIHRLVFQRFTVIDPDRTKETRTFAGRPWTARRVMRRLLEHEWEHYHHIEEIIAALAERKP
jgi:predicted RNase H-like HicB family nuclease